jgi:hypothetical protein
MSFMAPDTPICRSDAVSSATAVLVPACSSCRGEDKPNEEPSPWKPWWLLLEGGNKIYLLGRHGALGSLLRLPTRGPADCGPIADDTVSQRERDACIAASRDVRKPAATSGSSMES